MYTVVGCVTFDMVIDTDIGLLKFIQKNFNNPKIFYKSILDERDIIFMKHIMTERENKNPLLAVMIDNTKYISDADSLYNQFMTQHYEEILELSVTTGMFDIIRRSYGVNDVVRFDIICKSECEKDLIIKRFNKYHIRPSVKVVESYDKIDILPYGSIYVKDIRDILLFPKIECKNVLIGNYKFNFELGKQNLPLAEVAEKIIIDNPIQIIDMHAIDKSQYVG